MILRELQLQNYRNYSELSVEFSPGINILIGENAQGKTNLVEAIDVLAFTKSHRTAKNRELIAWNHKVACINGTIERRLGRLPLEIQLTPTGKQVKVNHLFQRKLSSYVGYLNVVLFTSKDLELIRGTPANRRQFMDMEFGQMSRRYLYDVSQFYEALARRNAYLRQLKNGQPRDQILLGVLADQLSQFGAKVIITRQRFIRQLEQWAKVFHQQISQGKEQLALKYVTQAADQQWTLASITDNLRHFYAKNESREIALGASLTGPHRDDIHFMINDQDVQYFGSQGQQRTAALAVKLAEIDLIREKTGEVPLLILDDVLSELDGERQTHLLTAIRDKVQTFLTTTSLDGVAQKLVGQPTIFAVRNGELTRGGK